MVENFCQDKEKVDSLLQAVGCSPHDEILSSSARGWVQIAQDQTTGKRCVVRVSETPEPSNKLLWGFKVSLMKTEELARENNTAARIYSFRRFAHNRNNKFYGLVPTTCPPTFTGGRYVVEKMEEINTGLPGQRMDLHSFIADGITTKSPRRLVCQYLHDVCHAVRDMHANGFAHLDVSLENICLNRTQAFLVDFESVLPIPRNCGFIKRKFLRVPLKIQTLPPEHFYSKSEDSVSLRGYDVWALGIVLFATVFKSTLIGFRCVDGFTELNMAEMDCLMSKGFACFLEECHPACHEILFVEKCNVKGDANTFAWWSALADLLSGIFSPPKMVRQSESLHIWSISDRLDADQILDHVFWKLSLEQ